MPFTYVVKNGKLLIAKAGGAGSLLFQAIGRVCCCDKGVPPIGNPPPGAFCAGDSTCNDWCTGKGVASRSPLCPCQCDGRRMFPPGFRGTWTGSFDTTSKVDLFGDGNLWQLVSPGAFTIDSDDFYCGRDAASVPCTFNQYASNGTTLISTQPRTLRPTTLLFQPGNCGTYTPDAKQIYVFANMPPGDLRRMGDNSAAGRDSGIDPNPVGIVDRCNGGEISVPAGDWAFSGADGTLVIKPVCKDCAGNSIASLFTGPPLLCAGEYDIAADINDGIGGATRTHLFVLEWDGAGWTGFSQYGVPATISATSVQPMVLNNPGDTTQYKCCPFGGIGDACASVSCVGGDDLGCVGCWTLTIADAFFFGQGSCPPHPGGGPWTRYDTAITFVISLLSFGFVEGCPT